MASLLLSIIYLAFVSLGLPDSVLGSVWPIMVVDLNAQISYMGIISIIITIGTITSSVFSTKIINKIGTGWVTAISVCLTAIGLLGFGLSNNFIMLCVMSLPYGIGAGAVDAALNNYVANHYSSRHMSWLHCCWGLGASIGPYIMGLALKLDKGWRTGYCYLAILQGVLSIAIFCTIFLWKRNSQEKPEKNNSSIKGALKIKGVIFALIAFFCYCAFESTAGLWATTYLVKTFNTKEKTATLFASFFYLGITLGRFLSGFFTEKLGDKKMIRFGCGFVVIGIILIVLPLKTSLPSLIGLIILGVGGAPVYPCLMHLTPINFGKENSQTIMGMQTASAYLGCTIMPPIFGVILQYLSSYLFGYYMLILVAFMVLGIEFLNKTCYKKLLKN